MYVYMYICIPHCKQTPYSSYEKSHPLEREVKYSVFDASCAAKPWLAMLVAACPWPLRAQHEKYTYIHQNMSPPIDAFVPKRRDCSGERTRPASLSFLSLFSQRCYSYYCRCNLYVVFPEVAVVTQRNG